MTDFELIEQFCRGSDGAFGELVKRHEGWVRASIQRRVHDPAMADDIAQAVFILLARKARSIKRGMVVSAWLFQAVQYCTASAMRARRRRDHHEKEAAAMKSLDSAQAEDWRELTPILDDTVARLNKNDRDAVMLRYYEQKPLADVAGALGISEEGARKRVSRAIDKLRQMLARRGFMLSADALSQAMLVGLAQSVSTNHQKLAAAALAGAGSGAIASAGIVAREAARLMLLGKIKLAAMVCGAIALAGGVGTVAIRTQVHETRAASVPATGPAADPAQLVQQIKDDQAWLATVDSFHAKFEGQSIPTPDGVPPGPPPKSTAPQNNLRAIGQAILESSRNMAATRPDANLPHSVTYEIAFDRTRFYERSWTSSTMDPIGNGSLRIWNGKTAIQFLNTINGNEEYGLQNDSHTIGQFLLISAGFWGRTGQKYWWNPPGRSASDFLNYPGDYRVIGEEDFHGMRCHVLEAAQGWNERVYVGVKDHKWYGLTTYEVPDSAYTQTHKARLEVAKQMGKVVKNDADLSRWVISQPEEKQKQFYGRVSQMTRSFATPSSTHWFADYHELAPGYWMPGVLGSERWDNQHASKPYIASRMEMKLVGKATVNTPLADELFQHTLKEGVLTWDSRAEPKLAYVQKKDRTPEEWAAIRADAQRQMMLFTQKRHASMLTGQPAPEIPANARWASGQAIKLADLRGKIVIVSFWANWRGFSGFLQKEVPDVKDLGTKSDVVVIAVHAPTEDVSGVQRAIKEYGVNCPVCIDAPAQGRAAPWGRMSESYYLGQLPRSYVIDRAGKIVGDFGWLSAVAKARELASEGGM